MSNKLSCRTGSRPQTQQRGRFAGKRRFWGAFAGKLGKLASGTSGHPVQPVSLVRNVPFGADGSERNIAAEIGEKHQPNAAVPGYGILPKDVRVAVAIEVTGAGDAPVAPPPISNLYPGFPIPIPTFAVESLIVNACVFAAHS